NFSGVRAMLDFSFPPGSTPVLSDVSANAPVRMLSTANAVRHERQRHAATVDDIRHILRPDSVVVIGASRNPQDVGSRIVEGLRASGFMGALYVVHSEDAAIQDVQTVRSVRDLPRGVDLAIVCVTADIVLKTIDECGQAGVRTVAVLSAGFAERGQVGRL